MISFLVPFQSSDITQPATTIVEKIQDITLAQGVSWVNMSAYWFTVSDRSGNILSHMPPNSSGADNFPELIRDVVIIKRDTTLPLQDTGSEVNILRIRFNSQAASEMLSNTSQLIANLVQLASSIPAGTNEIGKVQAEGTDGTNAHVLATDTSGHLILGAGTSEIGHVVVDTPAKGTTAAGSPTSASVDANTQAMHVAVASPLPAGTNDIGKINILDASGNNINTATDADGGATGAELATLSRGLLFNETGWDRMRGNTSITIAPSAARTASITAADFVNYNARGIQVCLNITAASGTGGLVTKIVGKDPISGAYYFLHAAPTAIAATGLYVYELYPGATTAGIAGVANVQDRYAATLPRIFTIQVIAGDSSSYTYSVGASLIL